MVNCDTVITEPSANPLENLTARGLVSVSCVNQSLAMGCPWQGCVNLNEAALSEGSSQGEMTVNPQNLTFWQLWSSRGNWTPFPSTCFVIKFYLTWEEPFQFSGWFPLLRKLVRGRSAGKIQLHCCIWPGSTPEP